jgi:hypothetical protein
MAKRAAGSRPRSPWGAWALTRRRAGRVVVLLSVTVLHAPVVFAQQTAAEMPGWWFVPAVRTFGVHQDNVQLTDQSHEAGAFLRVTSMFGARYRVPRRTFQALYAFESEKYTRPLRVLDDVVAQQFARARYESGGGGLAAEGRYVTTTRPEDVLEPTGLVAAYRKTTAAAGTLTASRRISPRLNTSAAYAVNFEDYGEPTPSRPSARSLQHDFTAAVSLQRSPRTLVALEQSTRILIGDDLSTRSLVRGTFWDGHVAVRLTHNVTPRLKASVLAGPRVAQELPQVIKPLGFTPLEWKVVPELLVSLSYADVERTLAVSYRRSAFLGFGASGFIDTQTVDVRAGYIVARRLRLSARPAVYRNSLSGLPARSYRLDAGAAYDISRWAALEAIYLYKYQDRALSLIDFGARSPGQPKTRTTIMFGVALTRPVRVK